jgi:peptidoglycan hydrolase-like protein with peptidoglycan-binding domain
MRLIIFILALLVATPVAAERRALVIVNGDTAADAGSLIDALAARGFDTSGGADLTAPEMRAALSDLYADGGAAERLVVVLIGRFVTAARGGWFLGDEVGPDEIDIATVGGAALDLATVYEVAALAPAGSVVLLGEVGDDAAAPGAGLLPGPGTFDALPQGIAVVRGPAEAVAAFVSDELLSPGTALQSALGGHPELEGAGLILRGLPFIPTGEPPVLSGAISAAEMRDWQAAQRVGTTAAYDAFLAAWPNGRFADQARDRLADLTVTPEEAETSLGLGRDARRAVQRALTELGYNTRGIDGIFGPGSRTAIAAWQRSRGYDDTGFLAAGQVAALQAEADRARAAREAEDRAYWRATGQEGTEDGLRAYLSRYPNGLYAATARQQLTAIEGERQAAADRAAWDRARRADTIAAYVTYLREFPNGRYVSQARARIDELEGNGNTRAEQAAWDRARRADTIGAYQQYLSDWPRGRHATEARARIAELTEEQRPVDRDDARWAVAERQNTAAAYLGYLAEFPNGRHATEAMQRLLSLGQPFRLPR